MAGLNKEERGKPGTSKIIRENAGERLGEERQGSVVGRSISAEFHRCR